jgi:hypothetical protein
MPMPAIISPYADTGFHTLMPFRHYFRHFRATPRRQLFSHFSPSRFSLRLSASFRAQVFLIRLRFSLTLRQPSHCRLRFRRCAADSHCCATLRCAPLPPDFAAALLLSPPLTLSPLCHCQIYFSDYSRFH